MDTDCEVVTVSCPGLHCPGCSDGQSLAVAGVAVAALVVAAETVQWVAERIWWIGATMAVCLVLSVAASMWLEGRTRRREAAWGAARGIYSRADVILPAEPARPAIAAPQVVNFNFYGADAPMASAIIRKAIPGTAGDAATERNDHV